MILLLFIYRKLVGRSIVYYVNVQLRVADDIKIESFVSYQFYAQHGSLSIIKR